MQRAVTFFILDLLKRLFARPAAGEEPRHIGRLPLLLLSLGFLVSTMSWAQLAGVTLTIGDAVANGMPSWLRLWPLLASVSLLLIISNPPGLPFLLSYAGLPLIILACASAVPFSADQSLSISIGPLFTVAGSFAYLLAAITKAYNEPVPLNAPLIHLAYPGAVGHLRSLDRLAGKWHWRASGPQGVLHAVHIAGRWDGRDLLIDSGTRFGLGYHFLRVVIGSRHTLRPFLVGVGGRAHPDKDEAARALQGTCQTSGRKIASFYVWDVPRSGTEQGIMRQMQSALSSGRRFLRRQTSVRSAGSSLVFVRKSFWRMTEQDNDMEDLLRWLASVVQTMEDGGLARDQ